MEKSGCVAVGSTEMYYVSFGSGGKNLVVLPGLSDGLATVRGKAWILSLPYRKYLRDYTVFLFSRKNEMPEGYTIREMADDQVLAMKKLGINRAYLLGVSQGGMIAQYIAIDHPEMVIRLILAVTAPSTNDTVKEAVSGWIRMAEQGDHAALMGDTAERMYSEPYLRKYRKWIPLLAGLTKPPDYVRFRRNADAILNFDARSELQGIRCPTLIIAGSDDRTVGKNAALELNRAVADSELYVYDGLGHGLFEEAKDFYERVFHFCG